MESTLIKKCTRCKKLLTLNKFIKNNLVLKTCIICRDKEKAYRQKQPIIFNIFYNGNKFISQGPVII